VIKEQVKKELAEEKRFKLYKTMLLDDAIATPFELLQMTVGSADWKITVPKSAPKKEHQRAKKLEFMRSSMFESWSNYVIEFMSYPLYGFDCEEIILEKDFPTPKGTLSYALRHFSPISQDSIAGWHIDKKTGEHLGLRQDIARINTDISSDSYETIADIPRFKYMHITHLASRRNPEGKSILDSVYAIWRYKSLLEEALTIGAIKDLSGIPVFYVPATKMHAAENDPSGQEAKFIQNLTNMMQGLHAGELTSAVLPQQYDTNGNKMYEFKLLGIEGAGKQYDVLEIIRYYNSRILIRFLADVLALGSNGSGSFALSDSKMAMVRLACNHHLKTIKEALNHDVIRLLYLYNDWDYDPEHSCRFEHGSIKETDLAELGSFIHRCVASDAIRPSKALEDVLLDNIDMEAYDEATEFLERTSKAGGSVSNEERDKQESLGQNVGANGDSSLNNLQNDTV